MLTIDGNRVLMLQIFVNYINYDWDGVTGLIAAIGMQI